MSAKKTKPDDVKKPDTSDKADPKEIETPEISVTEDLAETLTEKGDETDPVVESDAAKEITVDDDAPVIAEEPVEAPDTDPVTDELASDESKPVDGEDAPDQDLVETEAPSDTDSVEDPEAPADPDRETDTDALTDAEVYDAAPEDESRTDSDVEPEPQTPEDPPAPVEEKIVERIVEKKGGFAPAFFGGIVAALLGFAAGASDVLSPYLPASMQRGAVETVDNSAELDELRAAIVALESREVEPAEAPDLSGIEADIASGLSAQAEATAQLETVLSERLALLEEQVTRLAQAPAEAAISEEAIAAHERELAAVQEALATQRAEVESMITEAARMEAEADESARRAQVQAAATRLFAALDSAESYSGEVTELQSLGVTVPDALVSSADGVVPLSALQADFPALARTALATAREAEGASSGLGGFLQRQLGARSVTPRDGDDPDAILSRAEAALSSGDVGQALAELTALPEDAQAPLSDWVARAAARVAALGAADELAQSLTSN